MKNINFFVRHRYSLIIVIAAIFVGFIPAKASDVVLFTCPDIRTSNSPQDSTADIATSEGNCFIPFNVNASKVILDYIFDDGGSVYINNQLVFSIPNDFGVDAGTIAIAYPPPAASGRQSSPGRA